MHTTLADLRRVGRFRTAESFVVIRNDTISGTQMHKIHGGITRHNEATPIQAVPLAD